MKKLRGRKAMWFGLFAMLFGIIMLFAVIGAVDTKETVLPIAYNEETTIDDGQIYEFKNAVVFNEYAVTEYGESQPTDHFYIIGKYDKALDNWVLYNLCIDEDNELFETLDAYSKDENTQVGDLSISLCARASDFNNEDHQIRGYFIVAANEYNKEAFEGNAEVCGGFDFSYIFDSAADVKDYNRHNSVIKGVALGCILIFTILNTVIFYRNFRRITRGEV